MNTMNMPGFTAGDSLYKSVGRYRVAVSDPIDSNSVISQLRRPNGLCQKASRLCQNPERGGQWCDILESCFDSGDVEPPPPPPLNPCGSGWMWISGPEWCPTCCRNFSDGTTSCRQPLCVPPP